MGNTAGMPGLRGIDHIGITVPNVEQAVDFLSIFLAVNRFMN